MSTLTVKTVEVVGESTVEKAMSALGIDADLELEAGEGAQYDFAELTDDKGEVVWSTNNPDAAQARKFFDEVWS